MPTRVFRNSGISPKAETKSEFGRREELISQFAGKFNDMERNIGVEPKYLTNGGSFTLTDAKCQLYAIKETVEKNKVEDDIFRENFQQAVSLLIQIGVIDGQHEKARSIGRLFGVPMPKTEMRYFGPKLRQNFSLN